jgi:hypothetical protein
MRDFNDTREQITSDMRAVIAETEALLKAMATESKEQIAGITRIRGRRPVWRPAWVPRSVRSSECWSRGASVLS